MSGPRDRGDIGSRAELPPRIASERGPAAEALRHYAEGTQASGSEERAWRRLRASGALVPGATTGFRAWIIGFSTAAVVGIAVVLFMRPVDSPVASTEATPVPTGATPEPAPAPKAGPAPAPTPGPPPAAANTFAASNVPRLLPAGLWAIGEDLRVALARSSAATVASDQRGTRLGLASGEIALEVQPQRAGRRIEVRADPYRFVVVGTVFRVERAAAEVKLTVDEGAVAVYRRATHLATVPAGQRWTGETRVAGPAPAAPSPEKRTPAVVAAPATTGPIVPPSVAVSPPAQTTIVVPRGASGTVPPPLVRNVAEDCAATSLDDRLRCLERRAGSTGIAAETALYELAELHRDWRKDLPAALTAFQAVRTRFPAGVLRLEVDLSIIDLMPRLGRHAQALEESARFLAAHPQSERAPDLHLLRGNIFREVLGDCARAATEYGAAAASPEGGNHRARFLQAACLEALGRAPEAISAYRAFLSARANAAASDVAEAESRLRRLEASRR